MGKSERTQSERMDGPVPAPASWVGGARSYAATRHRPAAHHDGTCDAMYPGTALDRDGRCLLAEGHHGAHVYRGRGPARMPTRERAYQAEREEKKRRARVARVRERTTTIF